MNKRRAPRLLILLILLQSLAVAAEVYAFAESPVGEIAPHMVTGDDSGGAIPQPDHSHDPSTHHHCPHCCHCSWHAVASFSIASSFRAPASLPPYSLAFHSQHTSAFFRPPKSA